MPVTMAGALSGLALQLQQLGLTASLLAAFAGKRRTTKFLALWASRVCFGKANALTLLPLTKSEQLSAAQTQPLSVVSLPAHFAELRPDFVCTLLRRIEIRSEAYLCLEHCLVEDVQTLVTAHKQI